MVQYQRYNPWKKGVEYATEEEESQNSLGFNKITTRPRFLHLLFLFLFSCSLLLVPQSCFPSNFLLYSFGYENGTLSAEMHVNTPICSSISNGTICCDRSSIRFDICFMKGDVRTHSLSSSIYLYTSRNSNALVDYVPGPNDEEEENKEEEIQHEKIKPYSRKWENSTMDTVSELHLISKRKDSGARHQCDVKHGVPAVFFSTEGFTGNAFHDFNDVILPLYITSQHFNKRVVFVIADYHDWWYSKFGDILTVLSDYPPLDFSGDNPTHCFPEAIVGLRIHDELTVDPSLMEGGKSIKDFHDLLDRAYWPRINGLIKEEEEREARRNSKGKHPSPRSSENKAKRKQKWDLIKKPKLAIMSRKGSRAITNEDLLVKMAEQIGFEVEVLRPDRTTELAKIYRVLNSSDVLVGVHGAAMTHLLFVRPSKVFIQVIPLGTEWAAETYYGEPAVKLGLNYIGYKILPRESSLYDEYEKDDPVLNDPNSVHKKGWEFTKKVYLDHQNVRLNLERFRKRLVQAYDYSFAKKNQHDNHQS
ncbi:xylan glycosyltransferase MUCI21-like isoform X3 [Rhododendron vialii]|uniref:xylan glycosyltransferase MUCI21-like isoform X3 n=1 Tax=Rhododendron vialii TaxID=182163 RepID=UPI00265EEB1A|nr:xylan glycosyltransferase MUCI21-like isoform X3 [Rhododendron vialii]